jgi:8-oxo-dGTP pyrophosphatase MutT (NUDIX family)
MDEHDFYQISLKIFLKNSKGEVLVLKSKSGKRFAGFYDLPGGRIEVREFAASFEEVMRRELKEELGDIKIVVRPKPVAVGRHFVPAALFPQLKNDIHVLYLFFEADYVNGEIAVSGEHDGYMWLDLSRVEPDKYFTSGNLEGVKMYLLK